MNHKSSPKSIYYDSVSDVLYLGVKPGDEEEFIEIAPGINIEFDAQGEAIGVEILNASKNLSPFTKAVKEVEFQPIGAVTQ